MTEFNVENEIDRLLGGKPERSDALAQGKERCKMWPVC